MTRRSLWHIMAATGLLLPPAALAQARDTEGAVFALTNALTNSVAVYERDEDGMLSTPKLFPTQGQGTGTGLGSQGAVFLSDDGDWLAAVNAGSHEVTLFRVRDANLMFRGKAPSGGQMPISVAIHNDLVYVVNAGAAANISGFRISRGTLVPIAGSTRVLSGQAPAQISFNSDGTLLVVTEKSTNTIAVFTLSEDGLASGPSQMPSAGMTPFGFAIDSRDHLIVSEAFGGAAGVTATSSYDLAENGGLSAVTSSLKSGQTAACWVVATPGGRYAYVANTPSATITGLRVRRDGSLEMLDSSGVTARLTDGSAPTDMGVSRNGRFLYVLNSGIGIVGAYRIRPNGSLVSLAEMPGLPPGAAGLAAR